MALKHSNPSRPRYDRNSRTEQSAHAPYNFVPFPKKVVAARPLMDQDTYVEGISGWIECELTTCSPTYVRGMLTETQMNAQGTKKPDELGEAEKRERALFFSSSEEKVEGHLKPVLPGSSLRGMVRNIVEVISYGRVRWIAKEPTFTYRAVAASKDDPLRDPYRDVIGAFARNVKAGYLKEKNGKWYIQPALMPRAQGMSEQGTFLKVKENRIDSQLVHNYLHFNHPDYRPQWHKVSFDVEERKGKQGKYTLVTNISAILKLV